MSYQSAENEIEVLSGIKVSHSSQQRKRAQTGIPFTTSQAGYYRSECGWRKVRLRGEPGQASHWRDYKAVRLQSLYYVACFQDNLSLIDYVNSQFLSTPLVCLGDGHDGIWNLVAEFGVPSQRWEILDWYHLRENLYTVGGSLQRLHKAESVLWQGQVEAAIDLFADCQSKQAGNFCAYRGL
jgi:hypothetical protein